MDEFIRKVYERGKITIPKELRDLYGVRDGDMVKLRIVKVVQGVDKNRTDAAANETAIEEIDVRVESDADEQPEVA